MGNTEELFPNNTMLPIPPKTAKSLVRSRRKSTWTSSRQKTKTSNQNAVARKVAGTNSQQKSHFPTHVFCVHGQLQHEV